MTRATVAGKFDGENDYVDLGNILNFGVNDSFSLAVWVKTFDKTKNQRVINKGDVDQVIQAGNEGYDLYIYGQKICFQLQDSDSEKWLYSNVIENDTWYFVVAIVDRENHIARLYVDGEEVHNIDISTLGDLSNAKSLRIGAYSTNNEYTPLDGIVDEVRIYNRVLSEVEIKYLYHKTAPGLENLVLNLQFEEGSGTIVHDLSGNNNNGILYPTPYVLTLCEDTDGWAGNGSITTDTDCVEGSYSVKETFTNPNPDTWYELLYTFDSEQDFTSKKTLYSFSESKPWLL